MKSYIYSLTAFLFILFSCEDKNEKQNSDSNIPEQEIKKENNNLNISILLDLSDRIDPKKYPSPTMEYYQRDVQYISFIANSFMNHVKQKKVILLNDKIQVFFDPEPSDPEINKLSQELKISFDRNSSNEMLKSVDEKYKIIPEKIYQSAIKDNQYVGADIWKFFKNKVKDYCITSDHRNILVILTDGYIYHENSEFKKGNKTSYLTSQLIRSLSLNQSNWKDLISQNNYGYISANNDLSNLDVLVIGINPEKNNPFEGDVIRAFWINWLTEMGVRKFKIVESDLPSNLEKVISGFISNSN